jgi:hypothetical protein
MKVSELIQESYLEELFGLFKKIPNISNINIPDRNEIQKVEKKYNINFPVAFLKANRSVGDLPVGFYHKSRFRLLPSTHHLHYEPIELTSGVVYPFADDNYPMHGDLDIMYVFEDDDLSARLHDAPVVILFIESARGNITNISGFETGISFTEFYKKASKLSLDDKEIHSKYISFLMELSSPIYIKDLQKKYKYAF